MDLDAAAEELYLASPDEFVERRQLLVSQARAVGDRPLAQAIGQLRRPTRSAWLVNLLARRAAAEVASWLELGVALGDAQRRGSGPDLRRLSTDRRTALNRLNRRAGELSAELGHQVTEATRREVSVTLQAALADPAVAVLVRAGRVTQVAAYGGFGPLGLTVDVTADVVVAPTNPDPRPGTARLAAREAAQNRRAAAEVVLREAQREAAKIHAEAEQATSRADTLGDEVERLRSELSGAEVAERSAVEVARAARGRAQAHSEALVVAQWACDEARRALAELQKDLAELDET